MRKSTILLLLGLLLCAAQAQDATDSGSSSETDSDAGSVESEPAPQEVKKAPAVLSVDAIKAVVYLADGKKEYTKEGKLGDKLFKAAKLSTGQSVEVAFTPQLSGAAAKPQQAMLMAASKATPGLAAYAVAKVKKDGSHIITLSTSAIDKQLGGVGGELELSLLLGDPAAAKGVSGVLGSIVLPEAASGSPPKPKLLSAGYQPVNNFKPNIAHIFRSPDKRAPAVVSLAFTALAVAPLGLLVIYLGMLGVNLKGLPSGSASLWVLLFHGGIAAMLLLYLLFWLQLNLAQTLPLAMGLGLFMALTGYKALGALSAARITESKASSGPITVKKAN